MANIRNVRTSITDSEIMEGLTILKKYQEMDTCIKAKDNKVYVGKTESPVSVLDFQRLIDIGYGVNETLVTDPYDGTKYYCYQSYLVNLRKPWQFQTKYLGAILHEPNNPPVPQVDIVEVVPVAYTTNYE